LAPNGWGIYKLPLIKLQEVFTPARPTIPIQTIQKYQVFIILTNKVIHMAVRQQSEYTPDELRNNYEFKVVKRALMREYPWIKDVIINEEEINRFSIIFIELAIDHELFAQTYDSELTSWVKTAIKHDKKYRGMYPGIILKSNDDATQSKITNGIEDIIDAIHNSPALPQELKLKDGRKLKIGAYIVNHEKEEEW
jgi:hypothetical protein